MGQEKEGQNKVTTRNEEVGQQNARMEGKLAGTSTENDTKKGAQATFILSTDMKT
jgi:hypothetical protein